MIISMKKINSNNWALCSRALHAESPYILITNPPLVDVDNLYSFYVYNNSGLAMFYYMLDYILYDFLRERDYFYEED